jgi:predicted  nucleic acid-binding Zn-ribbon protein
MKYLIKPATYANEKKLTNLQTKKREEIERLREELARLVNIYESIERANAALNEQINRYRDEITRLQRLLREE